MACGACAAASAANKNGQQVVNASYKISQQVAGPCEYSIAMLQDFDAKLIWFKDTGKYRKEGILPRTMNKYIGIVRSSINVPNRCTYKEELDKIADLVNLIVIIQNGY